MCYYEFKEVICIMPSKNTRRDKGEGSIYQRKDGLWIAAYHIGKKPNGKPDIKYLSGKTETEVKKKFKAFKTDFAKNNYQDQEITRITVKEYMDKWMYETQINLLKPKTFDRKEMTLKNQIYPNIGNMQIDKLKADDVQSLINNLLRDGLSYSTIKKVYDAINACFTQGQLKNPNLKNPCLGVTLPQNVKKETSDIQFFNEEEIEKICNESIRKYNNGKYVYRLGYAIILLLYTGLRIGECLDLKWSDVDFENKTIKIDSNMVLIKNRDQNITQKYVLKAQNSTKTKAGHRIIPLSQKALDALENLQKLNGDEEYILSNSNGNVINPRNFDRMFRNILTQCNIRLCGVHILRHTFASMLFKKGIDAKIVSELLGHSDVTITYNTYIHLIKEQKQYAIGLLDEL